MELKLPMSYEEQLNKLIDHGFVVDDRDRVIDILKRVNYYRFTGYALQFRVSPEDSTYIDGTNPIFDSKKKKKTPRRPYTGLWWSFLLFLKVRKVLIF